MSTKAQAKTQAKTPVAPAAVRRPQPPVAEPEHEAERPDIAAQLEAAARLGHSLGAVSVDGAAAPIIQRQEIPEEEEEELQMKRELAAVQRQELPQEKEELMLKPDDQRVGPQGGQVPPEVEAVIHRARGGGQPLEGAVQEQMSEALGHDFSRVRVHTDAEADDLNQQLQAKAFTTGSDIFFERGVYEPGSSSGRELITHELTHVVQQSTGRVNGDGSGITVRPAGEAFEQEADRVAEAVTRSINTSVQRQTPEEEELQMQKEEEEIQTHLSESQPVTGSEDLVTRINSARGSGQSLSPTVVGQANDEYEKEEIGKGRSVHDATVMGLRAAGYQEYWLWNGGRGGNPAAASPRRTGGETHLLSIRRPYLERCGEGILKGAVEKAANKGTASRCGTACFPPGRQGVIQRLALKDKFADLEQTESQQYALLPEERRLLFAASEAAAPQPEANFKPKRKDYTDYPAAYENNDTYVGLAGDFRNFCSYYAAALHGASFEALGKGEYEQVWTELVDRTAALEVGESYTFQPSDEKKFTSQQGRIQRPHVPVPDPAAKYAAKIKKGMTQNHWVTVVAKDGTDVITSEVNAAFEGDRKPWFTIHKGTEGFYKAYEAEYSYIEKGTNAVVKPKVSKVRWQIK